MSLPKDAAFYTRPEHEKCRAEYTGCHGVAAARINCVTEGRSIDVCHSCASLWRVRVQQSDDMRNRCPGCADWQPVTYHRIIETPAEPIKGEMADAIDEAMLKEGILKDKRESVLRRLAVYTYFENSGPVIQFHHKQLTDEEVEELKQRFLAHFVKKNG